MKSFLLILNCLFILAVLLLGCTPSSPVADVIDGDTIRLKDKTTVRYLGIDTPEIGEPYYQQAKDYNLKLLAGKNVTLEADVTDKDIHSRLLRYAFANKILVNAELVKQGYAFVYSSDRFPDNKYYDIFKKALDDAISKSRGIWAMKSAHPKLKNKDDYYIPVNYSW